MTQDYQNEFRSIIQRQLANRMDHNPRYSLRAFARDLGVSPSRISEVLSGKQGLSPSSAEAMAQKMGLSQGEKKRFCILASALHSRSSSAKQVALRALKKNEPNQSFIQLKEDIEDYLSKWYFPVIRELSCCDDFLFNARNVAGALEMSELQADSAISTLLRLGLLKKVKDKYIAVDTPLEIPGGVPSHIIKKAHEEYLDRAKTALYAQPLSSRDFTTVVFSTDKAQLPKLAERMRLFARELVSEANKAENKNNIFAYSMQVFSLAELKKT